nr:hypothetical protein [Polyangiaceae bacterium]
MRKAAGPRGPLGGQRGVMGPARAVALAWARLTRGDGSARASVALAWALAIALLLVIAPARAEGPLDGPWSAGVLTERWVTGDWGEACGPKPAAQGAPAATVSVIQQAGELVFSGGGYNRTSSCYEAGLALRVRSHSANPRSWRTECASDANDSRQAHLVTTLSAPSDTILVFDETGEYQFLIKGQNCTASVRRSRTYVRARSNASAEPPPAPPPAETAAPPASPGSPTPPAPPTPPAGRCENPGEPAKLEVRPQRKLLRPGQSFAFRTLVLDAAGCRLAQIPAWSVVQGGEGVVVTTAGNVNLPAETPEGEIVLQASVGARSVRVTVEVAGEGRYAELLADRGSWAEGDERGEVAEVVLNTPRIG